MRWFHYVLPLALVAACFASMGDKRPPPEVIPAPITKEEAPRRTRATAEPFQWALQVHAEHVTNYEPNNTNQNIPLRGSDWSCVSMAPQTHFTDSGSYVESRQIICKLPGGQMIAGRTACTRDVDGTVDDDIQLLTLVDADGDQRGLVLMCGMVGDAESGTPTREPTEEVRKPTPPAPRTLDL